MACRRMTFTACSGRLRKGIRVLVLGFQRVQLQKVFTVDGFVLQRLDTLRALMITYTILGVPYNNNNNSSSIMGPKTLF